MQDTNPTQPDQNTVPVTNPQVQPVVDQPAVSTPTSPDAVSQDITKLKGLIQKFKDGIKQKRETAKQVGNNPQDTSKPTKQSLTKNKLLMISLAIFVVLCVLLVVASVYKSLSTKKGTTAVPTPTPEAVINATPSTILVPSRYATDSAVVELEKSINELDGQLTGTSIKETELTPPAFDFNITF